MSLIKEGDPLVQRVQVYSEKYWLYHAYIFPFIVVYAIWVYAWLFEDFYDSAVWFQIQFIIPDKLKSKSENT